MKQNSVILVLRVNTSRLSNQKNGTNNTETPGDLSRLMGTAQSSITIRKELHCLAPQQIYSKVLNPLIEIKRVAFQLLQTVAILH